ncbi:hypothetical protein ABPG72_013133 [Tetrahymena utriculariae]
MNFNVQLAQLKLQNLQDQQINSSRFNSTQKYNSSSNCNSNSKQNYNLEYYSVSKYNSASNYSSQLSNVISPCPARMHTLENENKQINGIYKRKAFINHQKELILKDLIRKDYNPYQIPPDWKAAEKHGLARKVGIDRRPSPNVPLEYDICPCCKYQIQKEMISIWEDPQKLSFLGSGYPLFFNYMEYCIYILVVIIISSGAFNIFTNFYGHSCDKVSENRASNDHSCQADWISIFSLANKSQQTADIQELLNFFTIFTLMILLIFFRKNQKEIDLKCDEKELTPSDFTIMVKDIPQNISKEELIEFFESNIECEEKIEVTEISYVYDTREVDVLNEEIDNIVEEKKKALSKLDPYSQEFRDTADKFDMEIKMQQKDIQEKMIEVSQDQTKFSGYAFVCFQTESQKQQILDNADKSFCDELYESIFSQSSEFKNLPFKDTVIKVSEAPEPLDIIWENMNKTDNEKANIRIFSFFVTVTLLITCAYAIYQLTIYQENQANQQDQSQSKDSTESSEIEQFLQDQYNSLMITIAIMVINSGIIGYVFRYLVTIESYNTHTLYNINLAQKLSLALFTNSALITCLISVIYTENVFGKGGLIYTIFYYFTIDTLTSVISCFLDYSIIWNKFLKWWYINVQGKKCLMTQKEANELCQLPDHEIEGCYAEIMNTMYITIFYSPAVPLGLFFSLIGIFMYFWVQKYILLRMKSVEKQISVKLSIEMTEYLEYVISIYAVSNALFKWQTVGGFPTLQIVGAVIGFVYSVLPIQLFVDKVFDADNDDEECPYYKAKHQFVTTYSRTNPVTAFNYIDNDNEDFQDQNL